MKPSALAIFVAASVLLSAPVTANAQTLKQVDEGVQIGDDPSAIAHGGLLLKEYTPYRSTGKKQKENRARNKAVVQRFFTLPIGLERSRLYANDGVKEIPTFGIKWVGLEAHRRNNEQNQVLFPGWSWSNVVIWETLDPTVFWVEAEGQTSPGATPSSKNHYTMQFVVSDGKITLFREFASPLKLTP
jgi:ketosteroid isomerase-like protein